MPDQAKQPDPGQPRELHLQKMAEQFMVGLQHHFDILAFNLASRAGATEEAYLALADGPRMMPAPAVHRNFEQTQAYARDLLFSQVISDSLNLAINCLGNVHLFLALVKANRKHGGLSMEAQQEAQKDQQEFLKSPLDRKFNRLEEEYGIMCELEDTIISLGFAIKAFVQQEGIVQAAQLDDQQELQFEFKVAPAAEPQVDLCRKTGDLETSRKTFREGEKLAFSDRELQDILLTVAVFGRQLFAAVAAYTKKNQPGG